MFGRFRERDTTSGCRDWQINSWVSGAVKAITGTFVTARRPSSFVKFLPLKGVKYAGVYTCTVHDKLLLTSL